MVSEPSTYQAEEGGAGTEKDHASMGKEVKVVGGVVRVNHAERQVLVFQFQGTLHTVTVTTRQCLP